MRFHSQDQESREREHEAERADMERQKKWDRRFLKLAAEVSSWSRDPSTKVGAVIVRPDNTIASLGYNGFPRGMSDSPELYADATREEVKYKRMVHAELNAILNAHGPVTGHTLYCTLFPCSSCALVIIQSGIKSVIAKMPEGPWERWRASFDLTKTFFEEAGIHCLIYPNE